MNMTEQEFITLTKAAINEVAEEVLKVYIDERVKAEVAKQMSLIFRKEILW